MIKYKAHYSGNFIHEIDVIKETENSVFFMWGNTTAKESKETLNFSWHNTRQAAKDALINHWIYSINSLEKKNRSS